MPDDRIRYHATPLAAAIVLSGIQVSCASLDADARIRQARKQAAERARRIIYNNDGQDMIVGATPKLYLADRMEQLPGTQVDTVFHCTGVTGLFTSHIPQVGEMLGEFVKDTSPQLDIDRRDNLRAMMEAGHDPLALAIDFCHKNDIEIFFSLRMNDIHDSMTGPDTFLPRWKRDHPHVTLGDYSDFGRYPGHDMRAWWSSLNYELPEVRDYVFSILEDVCTRYDADGLELDFLRHPKFFRPTLTLQPAEPRHLAAMNDLLRRIRKLTNGVAKRRGRPMPIACRVPLSVRCARALGLDLDTWLNEDLCDMLVVGGGYAPMAMVDDVREMVAFGHGHGVPVYACISESAMENRDDRVEGWRAAAMNIWHAGADGVYTFNYFPGSKTGPDKPDELLSQMGDPTTLKGLDKTYGVDRIVLERVGGYQRPGIVATGRLPIGLTPGRWAQVKLTVGEDVAANAPAGKAATTRLRVRVSNVVSGDKVEARLNGRLLGEAKPQSPPASEPASMWLEIDVDPARVAVADNVVELRLTSSLGSPRSREPRPSWDQLKLVLRYR